jgi:hypothetical protein
VVDKKLIGGDHELILLVTPWAFATADANSKRIRTFRHAPFYRSEKGIEELKAFLKESPDPSDESPLCIFASPYYSFVPEDLYDPEDEKRMLDLAFSEGIEEEGIRSERSMLIDSRVVHWYPSRLIEALTDRYPGFVPHHFTIPAIENLLALNTHDGKACGLAHIRHGEVDVGFAVDGELRIFNSFSYANAEELVYFILHTWRTCGAGEGIESFHVMGTTPQTEEKELLERYVQDPVLYQDENGHWLSFLLDELPRFADHQRET